MTITAEIVSVARAMRDYIDALPSDVVAALPTMPGFDRDWADEVIDVASRDAQPVAYLKKPIIDSERFDSADPEIILHPNTPEGWHSEYQAVFAAPPAPVALEGFKLMPIEMTDEIGEAIAMEACCCGGIALCIYEAALAAAPEGGN